MLNIFFQCVQSLSNENCLVVPPVCLVSNTLEHGRNVNALLDSKRFKGSVMAVRLHL